MESSKKGPRKQIGKTLLDGVAVCEKNTAGVVSFQSPESVAICGHKSGEFCSDCHRDREIGQTCELVADRIYYHQQVYSRVEIRKIRPLRRFWFLTLNPGLNWNLCLNGCIYPLVKKKSPA